MSVGLGRNRGAAPIGSQYRQVPDLLGFHRTAKLRRMFHHINLRDDFADEMSMTEKSDHRTLRNHNADRFGRGAHICGGNVTAAKSQWNIHVRGYGVKVAASRKNDPVVTHDEAAIQLRQFLYGAAKIEISNVARRLRMSQQGIQD